MTKRPRIQYEKIVIDYMEDTNFWEDKEYEGSEIITQDIQNDVYITLLTEKEDFDDWEFGIDTHFYHLYDQEGDSTNMTESWGTYDEAFWPRPYRR